MLDPRRLQAAEAEFLTRFPKGFADPEMEKIGKKHRMGPMIEFARESFSKPALAGNVHIAADNMVKAVSRSSMVSLFEKPKFRDYVNGMHREDRAFLAQGFKRLLHGKQEQGFNDIVDVLVEGKLAKWSLLTICLLYYRPQKEVFVKPTTTKNVIRQFELENLVYRPLPSWDFYRFPDDDAISALVLKSSRFQAAYYHGFFIAQPAS